MVVHRYGLCRYLEYNYAVSIHTVEVGKIDKKRGRGPEDPRPFFIHKLPSPNSVANTTDYKTSE